jgi:hypothetical protein
VYAQQLPPEGLAPLPPGVAAEPAPEPAFALPAEITPEETPFEEQAYAPVEADPVLTDQENRVSQEVAEAAAEEIPLEDLEPPPPPPPPPPPMRRPRHAAAVIMAVDKITAETLRFEAKVGVPVRYKTLVFTLRACESTAPDETIKDEIAHLEVISQPKRIEGRPTPPAREVYKGWAFASSPALHPIEHPLYDAWLVGCRKAVVRKTGDKLDDADES